MAPSFFFAAGRSFPGPPGTTTALRGSRAHSRGDDRLDSAANVEVAHDLHPPRLACGREIVEDPVHRALVEDPVVAKTPQVELQRLELETELVGDVRDDDRPEIRCAAAQLLQLRGVRLDPP